MVVHHWLHHHCACTIALCAAALPCHLATTPSHADRDPAGSRDLPAVAAPVIGVKSAVLSYRFEKVLLVEAFRQNSARLLFDAFGSTTSTSTSTSSPK